LLANSPSTQSVSKYSWKIGEAEKPGYVGWGAGVGLGVGSGVGVTAGSSTFAMFRRVAAKFFACSSLKVTDRLIRPGRVLGDVQMTRNAGPLEKSGIGLPQRRQLDRAKLGR
jgi:hypothetical protein